MSTSSTSPFAPVTLNGVSQYSSDLQSILNRAVQIAQIPVTRLQNTDSTVLSQKTELVSLQSDVAALASSMQSLGQLAASQAISATSSNPDAVTVTSTGATSPATYTINSITSPATAASETSLSSYADSSSTPVSSTGNMELVVGSQTYNFTLAANNLLTLRDTINSLNAGVTASILTTSGGNYLAVSATSTGATTLQLIDDPSSASNPNGANTQWLTNLNQGSNAQFQLNGINVSEPSNTVSDVIPGVTFTIQAASSTPTTLSLQSDPSQLSSALQDFVAKYNQLQSDLSRQEGQGAGDLAGDTVITQLQSTLQQIASYTNPSGGIHSLSDLGLEFDATGTLSLNQTTFDQLNDAQLSDAFKFIGSATSGLGAFSTTLEQFSDPVNGIITVEQSGLTQEDQSLQQQISTLTDRINLMQSNLASQLQKADAFIADLQNQQTAVNASIQGLNYVLYGKNPNQTT
ncbi:MAG TPA: flagellar filament capping protein FliD [Bryobacteraceae bacterium]|nr:flagellar filament capping protein FliD [Bryobacteraceae bacterium]